VAPAQPEPEPRPAAAASELPSAPARQVSGIPVRRRAALAADVQRRAAAAEPPPPAAGGGEAAAGEVRAGDGSAMDTLPLWRLKDVFIEATTLDREIRMLRKRIDPKSRAELTRIIEFCRDRLAAANRASCAAAAAGASPDHHHHHHGKPTAASPRPSLLRQPSVRADGGDASTPGFRSTQL